MQNGVLQFAVVVLALSGCASVRPAAERSNAPLTGTQFRTLFPAGNSKLAGSVLGDYNRVQAALLRKSMNGARAKVSLMAVDGTVHSGFDEFVSGEENRIKEVRDNYLAVQVGSNSCVQTIEKMKCRQGTPLQLGLVEIDRSHISRVWSKDLSCFQPSVPCRFIKIQIGSEESSTNSTQGYSAEPDLVGHDYELLFTLQDYLPIYYRQTDHYHVSDTAIAFYSYEFDQPVEEIRLPGENESIRKE